MLDYWDWVQAKQEETKPVRVKARPDPGRGNTWSDQRVYDSMGKIFALYGPQSRTGGIDPDVAAIDLDELMDAVHDFDMTEMDEWDS